MKIEKNIEIKSLDELLLLEIDERVNQNVKRLNDGLGFKKHDIEILKMDKETLEEGFGIGPQGMILNLKKKVDFLINEGEKK